MFTANLFVAAAVTVFAQAFFTAHAGDDKEVWLSVCLIGGAVTAILGIHVSRWLWLAGAPQRLLGFAGLAALAVTPVVLLTRQSPAGYAITHAVLLFVAELVLDWFDRTSVEVSGAQARQLNDRVTLAVRFLGWVLGPLWAGVLGATSPAGIGLVGGCLAISVVAGWRLTPVEPEETDRDRLRGPLRLGEREVLGVSLLLYCITYIMAGSLMFLLADHIGYAEPSSGTGIILAVVFTVSALTAALPVMSWGRALDEIYAVGRVFAGALLIGAVCAVFYVRWTDTLPSLILVAAVIGVGQTFIIAETREVVSRSVATSGDPRLLNSFNNLPNYASLLGFVVMAGLAVTPFEFIVAVLFTIGVLGLIMCGLAMVARARLLAGSRAASGLVVGVEAAPPLGGGGAGRAD